MTKIYRSRMGAASVAPAPVLGPPGRPEEAGRRERSRLGCSDHPQPRTPRTSPFGGGDLPAVAIGYLARKGGGGSRPLFLHPARERCGG